MYILVFFIFSKAFWMNKGLKMKDKLFAQKRQTLVLKLIVTILNHLLTESLEAVVTILHTKLGVNLIKISAS